MTAPIRILTADDHPLIRAGVASFLATEPGLEVVAEATNGEEALEQYRRVQPDVVLMDLSMPVMDGLAATRCIRRHETAHIPIVALSAHLADPAWRERALRCGCDYCCSKPLDFDALDDLLDVGTSPH
jgi:two-component system, NarL family, response regulator